MALCPVSQRRWWWMWWGYFFSLFLRGVRLPNPQTKEPLCEAESSRIHLRRAKQACWQGNTLGEGQPSTLWLCWRQWHYSNTCRVLASSFLNQRSLTGWQGAAKTRHGVGTAARLTVTAKENNNWTGLPFHREEDKNHTAFLCEAFSGHIVDPFFSIPIVKGSLISKKCKYIYFLLVKREMTWNEFKAFLWRVILFYRKREVRLILWGMKCASAASNTHSSTTETPIYH